MTFKRALAALATTALMVTPAVAQAEASKTPAAKLSVSSAAETSGLRAGAKGKRSKLAEGAIVGIVLGAAAVTGAVVAIADDNDEPASP
jgi:hypothetical protein